MASEREQQLNIVTAAAAEIENEIQIAAAVETDVVSIGAKAEGAAAAKAIETDDLLERPPEILVAYLSGEPEAVAAIELLREAQRVWNERKTKPGGSADGNSKSAKFLRRYSHDDLRMAYTNISARLMTMAPLEDVESGATQESDVGVGNKSSRILDVRSDGDHIAKQPRGSGNSVSNVSANYRRRASAQVEASTVASTSRYQKNPAVRNKRYGSSSSQKKLSDAAIDLANASASGAGITGAHSAEADSMHTSSAATDPTATSGGSPSSLLTAVAAEAASIRSEQLERRRASSKASAIFLVSATSKDCQLVPEDEDDGSPEGRRRRRTISIIATVGAFLLVLSILLVTVTLRLASHIDDIGKESIHLFTVYLLPPFGH